MLGGGVGTGGRYGGEPAAWLDCGAARPAGSSSFLPLGSSVGVGGACQRSPRTLLVIGGRQKRQSHRPLSVASLSLFLSLSLSPSPSPPLPISPSPSSSLSISHSIFQHPPTTARCEGVFSTPVAPLPAPVKWEDTCSHLALDLCACSGAARAVNNHESQRNASLVFYYQVEAGVEHQLLCKHLAFLPVPKATFRTGYCGAQTRAGANVPNDTSKRVIGLAMPSDQQPRRIEICFSFGLGLSSLSSIRHYSTRDY